MMRNDQFSIRARLRHLRMSPRKARLVVDVVRGMPVEDALAQLDHLPNAAARPLGKLIRSAAANAEESYGLSADELYVAEVFADGGPTAKRGYYGGRGRFKPVLKRTCHLSVALREIDPQPLPDEVLARVEATEED